MIRKALFLILLCGAVTVLAATAPVHADSEIQAEETDETIKDTVKSLRRVERSDEELRARLKALEQQHEEMEFRRRTGASFRSERALRHDLRRNEKRQGWVKREDRRLDYEVTRQRQDLRNQTHEWRRR